MGEAELLDLEVARASGKTTPDALPFVLIAAAAVTIGSILSFQGLDYCPNDASRWSTIYYLVEHGTYAFLPEHGAQFRNVRTIDPAKLTPAQRQKLVTVDGRYYESSMFVPVFATIDMVLRRGDGYEIRDATGQTARGRLISSKPPLLPTCLAGVVWFLEKATGADFREDPWFIMRTTLVLAQGIPFLLFVYVMSLQVRRLTNSAFVRNFCIVAAGLATYLTPWTATLNNHVFAAFFGAFALHATIEIWYGGRRAWYWFGIAGFCSAFAATNELPAALLTAAVLAALIYIAPTQALLYGVPTAAVPIIAFFVTNYIATGSLSPSYAGFGVKGGPYDYPGSYWQNPQGIDALNESWWFYEANILVGHHGFFLLTPLFVVGMVGLVRHLQPRPDTRALLAGFVIMATAVIACFYTFFTSESKNYGGTTQGARWMFWLIPLWLLFLPTGVERLARSRAGRLACYAVLGVSMFSAFYALRQPWSAPWAQVIFRQLNWIDY